MQNDTNNKLFINPALLQYGAAVKQVSEDLDKLSEFKERIFRFREVETLADAKALATKILPTANEFNSFYVGTGKCVVINRDDLFRIYYEDSQDFIAFDFV